MLKPEELDALLAPVALYPDALPLFAKIETVAREIYRADGVSLPAPVAARLRRFEEAGFGDSAVCVAKTQYSFSADPTRLGALGDLAPHVGQRARVQHARDLVERQHL